MLYQPLKKGITPDMTPRLGPASNHLLAQLPKDEIESISALLEEVQLPHRRLLQDMNSAVPFVYFICEGLVSFTKSTGGGEDVETELVGAEGVVGAPLALGVLTLPCRATVRVAGRAFRLPASHLLPLMALNKVFCALLLRYLANSLFEMAQNVACASRHTIPQRIARWLLTSNDRLGGQTITCTHDYLSQALGVRRAGVTVELGQMETTGLVQQNRGSLVLKDRARLEARSCDCYRLSRLSYERVMG